MEKVTELDNYIEWSLPKQLDPPTRGEIDFILSKIRKKAKSCRAFDIFISQPMYVWLKENLENAHIVLLDCNVQTSTLNTHWIVVGQPPEKTAIKYAERI